MSDFRFPGPFLALQSIDSLNGINACKIHLKYSQEIAFLSSFVPQFMVNPALSASPSIPSHGASVGATGDFGVSELFVFADHELEA